MNEKEQVMIIHYPKTSDPGKPGKDEKAAEARAGDDCRCKEASQMSPGELLKLMVNDLAFWKKTKTPKN